MFFIHVIIKYHMSIEEKRVSDHLLLRFKYIREIKINRIEHTLIPKNYLKIIYLWCYALIVHVNTSKKQLTKKKLSQFEDIYNTFKEWIIIKIH